MKDDATDRVVGEVLAEAREAARFSRRYAAEYLWWSQSLVGMHECGVRRVSVDQFVGYCDVYGVSARALMRTVTERLG